MSVLIRDMKMPKNCMDCPMNYDSIDCTLVFDISLRDKDNEFMYEDKRHPKCPLIELPTEHGRLGDLDAMAFDESEAYMSAQAKLGRDVITTGINSIVHRKIQLLIMDTPTIIESEVSK